jgi:hypothetical protein
MAGGTGGGLAHIFAAAAPAAAAGWFCPRDASPATLAALASLASGLVAAVGAAERPASAPRESTGSAWDPSAAPISATAIAAAAGAFALAAIAAASGASSPAWVGGLVLWGSAVAVRTLVLLALAGAYHCLRPGRISWPWILATGWLSFPGALSAAWLASASAGPVATALVGLVFPALCASLLVEGPSASVTSRRPLDPDSARGWELLRGRRIALRAARQALDVLAEEGDLEQLPRCDRDDLERHLERRLTLADLELEEMLHSGPRLRAHGRQAVLRELGRAATRSLEEAARAGVIPRGVVDSVRAEVAAWLESAARPAGGAEPDSLGEDGR